MAIYTKIQIETRIKEINTLIARIESSPASVSGGGISANFNGRLRDLREEREYWADELKKVESTDSGKNPLQGPKLVIQ